MEAAALLFFALAAFLVLSLSTFEGSPFDPTVRGADWAGPVGAVCAQVLVQGFGLVAWLAPLELVLLGAPFLRRRLPVAVGLRVAGDLIVAIVLSALLQLLLPAMLVFGAMRVGGNVGLLFGELMRGLFSTPGSLLVGSTVVGLILVGRSSFSFIEGCARAWQILRALAVRLVFSSRRLLAAWGQARRLHRESERSTRADSEPRIDAKPSDDAIIAQLDDDTDWIPLEVTGCPPVALAESLGRVLPTSVEGGAVRRLDAADTEPETPAAAPVAASEGVAAPSLVDAGEPEPAASPELGIQPADEARTEPGGAVEVEPAPSGPPEPLIVDTKPQQKVTRTARGPAARRRERGSFVHPSTDLLALPPEDVPTVDKERVLEHAHRLEKTLRDYGVQAKVEEIHPGPTVTTYEVAPEAGTKVSKVANLSDDLALGLSRKVRIIAPIPGKSRIGFELPNDERLPVNLRELIEDKRFAALAKKAPLPVVLGRDIVGAPYYADLASMPHVIVAGATGAGKSVGLNVMLSSLLFCRSPEELRMLMIDPKVVELAPFDGIPHMLLPVVTDMKQAAVALRWAVDEMERRYQLFANAGTKNITTYNHWVDRVVSGELPLPARDQLGALAPDGSLVSVSAAKEGDDGVQLPGRLPHIVVVVDEFADLMMQQGKDVEASVARLAQKARAAGMHVVLATQRPSVDVITGMIKANFPTRIAYRVAQKVDSRTILDEQGAEVLLGRGDMLVKMNGSSDTRRVQCPFISEEEVSALTDYLRTQGTPEYHEAILQEADDGEEMGGADERVDARFDEAVQIVADTQRCSTSWLQRKMTIGYNRAAKIVETMEKRGIVGPPNGAKDREIFVHPQ